MVGNTHPQTKTITTPQPTSLEADKKPSFALTLSLSRCKVVQFYVAIHGASFSGPRRGELIRPILSPHRDAPFPESSFLAIRPPEVGWME
jgi:hypothetical protein